MQRLPVDERLEEIVALVKRERRAVIVAPPGSGKTTRIPPALTALGRTILLQPRRVAARALARRIAEEHAWTIGEEVGWQIRFERRFRATTQLLVATEGILTARLQADPLLSDFSVVVLDEFHERGIHGDLAFALAHQAMLSRDDLHIVVMSATIDAGPVARFLEDAPIVTIDARRFPVEVRYRPAASPGTAIREALTDAKGDVLCFLPGAREIERAAAELGAVDALVLPLHGSLDVEAQERALAPASRRKVILSTNVAETSLTVEGVTNVIDAGLQKVLRYDVSTAVDHLVTERISLDSADQRAGRAGRTQPGRTTRLWDSREILRAQREPEIRRVDLAAPLLDIVAWGGDPESFEWFERPPAERLEAAMELLSRLGALEGRKLTAIGELLRAFPLHPRLARAAVAGKGSREVLALCIELSDGGPGELRDLTSIARRVLGQAYQEHIDDDAMRRALLAGYPDRVAMRREKGSPLVLLATGTGAKLAREADDGASELVLALDITGELIRRAVPIERVWLDPLVRRVEHRYENGRVRARELITYGELVLREQQVPADPLEAQRLMAQSMPIDEALQRRVAFAGLEVDWSALRELAAAANAHGGDLARFLPFELRRKLDELAPESLPLPSGRTARLDYRADGGVHASAKLQELFGLAETPRLGPRRTPVTLSLLSPAGRPVQVTQDLRSFWNSTYAEVRKELRPRYPKHPWPDDPWTATPTHRTTRRK
jgi:ATP-dependent helicase HrpB